MLLVCLVVVTALVVAVRSAGHQGRPGTGALPGPPPVRVISAGHRLLGVQAGWQLFARGPDDLLRIQLARGPGHLDVCADAGDCQPGCRFCHRGARGGDPVC